MSVSSRERAIGTLEDREIYTLYRRRNGITQVAVAELTGISQPLISVYEKGHVRLSAEKVTRLWDAAEELARTNREARDAQSVA